MPFWSILVFIWEALAQHRCYLAGRKYKVQRPRRWIKRHLWRLGPLRLGQGNTMRPALLVRANILVFVDAWETLAQHRRYLVGSIAVLAVVQSRKHKVHRPRRWIKHHLWRLGPLRLWQGNTMRPAQKYVQHYLTTSTCKYAILVDPGLYMGSFSTA